MTRDAATSFARTLVDEWVRGGVTDAVLAPGSRSTPLVLALARDDRVRVHVFLDERSAAFFALGTARASGRPAVALCTSGTAAANFHPAVLEASHGRVPLIACTADRPPEARDTGSGQTIDQARLFGDAVRWFADPGPPEDQPDAVAMWRALAARSVAESVGPPAGPVHLNLPFREPLVPTGDELIDVPGRSGGRPWTATASGPRLPAPAVLDALADLVSRTPRGLVMVGWGAGVEPSTVVDFAAAAGWPVLADGVSGVRVPGTVSTYDPLLRNARFAADHRPDVVVRLGAPLTNRPALEWLDGAVGQVLVDPDGARLDPRHAASGRVIADAEPLLTALSERGVARAPDAEWIGAWRAAETCARDAIDTLVDGWDEPFEGRVARDVAAAIPDGGTLVVGSSMPVRDLESFARPRDGLRVVANRGVNGIDGFASTTLGVAAGSSAPVVALCGDLCFLHDANGLLDVASRDVDSTFVVVDNGGGGIFSFLPQAQLGGELERLFATPQPVDIAAVGRLHGLEIVEVVHATEVAEAVRAPGHGVRIVRVRTDRAENVSRHRAVWAAVASAVGDAGSG